MVSSGDQGIPTVDWADEGAKAPMARRADEDLRKGGMKRRVHVPRPG